MKKNILTIGLILFMISSILFVFWLAPKGYSQTLEKDYTNYSIQKDKADTISVVMLYSDSSIIDLEGVDDNGDTYETIGIDVYTYWRRGYVVSKYNFDIIYLDENKKQVPTSNIIWQFKKTK